MSSHPSIHDASATAPAAPRLRVVVPDDEPRRSHPTPEWCAAYDRFRITRRAAATPYPRRRTHRERVRDAAALLAAGDRSTAACRSREEQP